MEARSLTEEDYGVLVEWWVWNRFPPPPKEFLPAFGAGGVMIVDKFGNNICAGFIYNTNSALAWIEFIIASPYVKDKNIRKKSQTFLIETLTNVARELGYLAVFASIKSESLIQRYIEAGYSANGNKSTELVIRL